MPGTTGSLCHLLWPILSVRIIVRGGPTQNEGGAMLICVNLGEFRSEEKNLGGVINPNKEGDQRTGCAVYGCNSAPPDKEPDQSFSDGEQKGSHSCADPDIAPPDFDIW